jgi:hypothetical protein
VSPVKYKLGFYIPQDDILHSHSRDNLKFYIKNISFNLEVSIGCLRFSDPWIAGAAARLRTYCIIEECRHLGY